MDELRNDFNVLKQEIDNLKVSGGVDFSLYNKDSDTDESVVELTALVRELEIKINTLTEQVNNIPVQNQSNVDNSSISNTVAEIKTNYFILTQAITLMKEKYDSLQIGTSPAVVAQVEKLEEFINELKTELNELNASSLKDGALTETLELIKQLESRISELESKINNLKEVPVVKEVKEEPVKEVALSAVEPVQTPTEQVTEEPIQEPKPEPVITPIQTELIEEDITAKVYDIKIIETTLHEARLPECKAIKKQLINAWTMLEAKVGSHLMYAAKILSNGLLVANGKTHLLIVYPTAQLCNHIMMPKHYANAKEVLKATLGKAYDFVALPDDTWKEKRLEYHDKFRVGDVYPELTPINNPKLRVVIRKDSPKTERELTLEKANDFFGDDE